MKKALLMLISLMFVIIFGVWVSATVATGGTITYDGDYTIHTFNSNGTFIVTSGGNVEYLVVGGGGGGNGGVAAVCYGAGGAGGTCRTSTSYMVTTGNKTIIVGHRGAAANQGIAGSGGNSVFDTITATGGGGVHYTVRTGPSNVDYQGGISTGNHPGASGAGCGGNGQNAVSNNTAAIGGIGIYSSISGSLVGYGGGGHGGGGLIPAGNYGAGAGSSGAGGGGNGVENTGGGGSGGDSNHGGGSGGSGIIIIKYLTTTQPTYTSFSGDPDTTNFSDSTEVPDLTNVTEPVIAAAHAKIKWRGFGYDVDGRDLDNAITFGNNFVRVDSAILTTFNSSANVTLKTTSYPNLMAYNILKDGQVCSDCTKYLANPVKFSVTGFSNYTTNGTGVVPEFNGSILLILTTITIIGLFFSKRYGK